MKEKKSKGLRKVLYMAIATVLVIAISVSATLAFLTDSTVERDNVFKGASNDIQGSIKEPSFNSSKKYYYSPGKETPKDPMVQNDSLDDEIYTGVKVTFFIKAADSGSYVQVPYDVFDDYVTVKYGGSNGFNTGTGATQWTDITGWTNHATKAGYDDNAKYFVYNSKLTKTDGTDAVQTEAINGTDTSKALFSSVKMSEYIHIPENVNNNKKVINALRGTDTATDKIYIDDAGAKLDSTHQYEQDFEQCDIKICIEGYGVKAESTTTLDNAKASLKDLFDGTTTAE